VLLRVNAQVTTLGEFKQRLAEARLELAGPVPAAEEPIFQSRVLESVLEEMLILERARELNHTVTKGDLDRSLETIRQRNKFPDLETVYQAAEQAGLSREVLHAKLERQILMEWVMGAEVFPRRDITDWELRQYYDTIQEDFTVPEAFRLREMVLLSGPGLEVRRDAAEKSLAEGTPFEEVAKRYSQSPTAEKGGDLGPVSPGDLSEELQAALKGLNPGETSAAVEVKHGLHYLHLVEIIPAHPRPFEEVKDQLPDRMFREQYKDNIESYLEGLKGRYLVVINDKLLKPEAE